MKKRFQQCIAILAILSLCFSSTNTQAAWYTKKTVVTHAGGQIGGCNRTNSKEALKKALQNKKTTIELDFMFTSDGQLVCSHGWENEKGKNIKAPTYAKFKKTKVKKRFTPLSAAEAISYLKNYPDVYLVVDTQEKKIKKVYEKFAKLCDQQNCKNLLKRVIPQIYKDSDYKAVRSVYKFKNVIYSLYKKKPKTIEDYKKIAKFCKAKKIKMVAIEHKKVSSSIVNVFHKYDVKCGAHTVNQQQRLDQLKNMGVDLIYSDTLS